MGDTKQRPHSISGPLSSSPALGRSVDDDLDALMPGALPQLGAVIAAKYRVDRLIARGGMGAVYAATHLVSGKRVALKWMLPSIGQVPDARERFIREACATARIDHPNIVDIYDVGDERGSVYLVMEYLRGETLSERLEREIIPAQEAIGLFIPALRGVAAAHSHGVIHRDLKPDNIFLCRTAEGEPLEPKVLDFGISKITGPESRDHSLTRSGAVLGTPYYMSPEQVRGARDVDQRADVYAFGVMLYEVLTGQRPFDAETYNQLILKIVTETPAPVASLNPAIEPRLVQIVERAMARDPHLRYPTVEALALALEPFAGGVRFRSSATPFKRSEPAIEISPTLLEATRLPAHATAHSGATQLTDAASTAARRRRHRATLASALAALVVCSIGYFWLHKHTVAARTAALGEHVLTPAAAQLPPGPVEATDAQHAPPTATGTASGTGTETTTNAAQASPAEPNPTQPNDATHASVIRAHTQRDQSKGAVGSLSQHDKSTAHEAVLPNANHVPADWDERLSTDPARPVGSDAIPAGHIDRRDFR
jgi:serine/threonine protein kinase